MQHPAMVSFTDVELREVLDVALLARCTAGAQRPFQDDEGGECFGMKRLRWTEESWKRKGPTLMFCELACVGREVAVDARMAAGTAP